MSEPDTTTTGADLRELGFADVAFELALTRRFLERVPEEHWTWKPHERSYDLGSLAAHLANLPLWQLTILTTDGVDLVELPERADVPSTREALLASFDRLAGAVREALHGLDDDALRQPWTLRRGDQILQRQPRATMLRTAGLSHMVHHRAQLGLYFRLVGVPVPSTYGPSADESA